MISQEELVEFYSIANEIVGIYLMIPKAISPVNYIEEKQKFFSKRKYNIQLKYNIEDWDDGDFAKRFDYVENQWSSTNLPRDLKNYLANLLGVVKIFYTQASAVGRPEFSQISAQLYSPRPLNNKYLDWIKGVTDVKFAPVSALGMIYDANGIKSKFAKFLRDEGIIEEYQLLIDNSHSPETIRISGKKVIIGSHMVKTEVEVKRLIVHELKTHVRRGVAGRHHELATLRKLVTPEQSETEEGLAIYNEITSGCITEFALRRYGLRALGVVNLDLKFYELYELARDHLSEDESFLFAYRLKRGLSNTSHKGGYARDLIYFNGYTKIMEFVNSGGNVDDLYIGKISIEDLVLVKKYGL